MATQSYHNCPICKEDIEPGEPYRIIGFDQSRPGEPPISIYAHRYCIAAVGFTGAVILTSTTEPGHIFPQSVSLPEPVEGNSQLALAF